MLVGLLRICPIGQDKGPFAAGGDAVEDIGDMIRSVVPQAPSSLSMPSLSLSSSPSSSAKSTKPLLQLILDSPTATAITTLGATAGSYAVYRRYFRRIPTAAYITPSTMRWRRTLVGRCTSVGDADGFRLYHTPGPPLYRHLLYGKISGQSPSSSSGSSGHSNGGVPSTQTISVRLAGADAPESGHFGKPAQPFAKEAKQELERLVLGRQVWIQPAHVDQYQRLVATPYVWLSPYVFGRTNVSLHLVKRGLATVYTQSGAAYGTAGPFARFVRWTLGLDKSTTTTTTSSHSASENDAKTALLDRIVPMSGEARLRRAMARAKRRKLGIWSLKNVETPEEYKRRVREKS